jgi:Transcriptional regulators of sugar metabolism
MLFNERQQQIIEFTNKRGTIKVSELSTLLNVSPETIRYDLRKLENAKKLYRVHGSSCSISLIHDEIPYFEREITNVEDKTAIAREAVKYINEGEKIILDSSSTSWFVAKQLPNVCLTVLTNSLRVANELVLKDKIEVVLVGGILLRSSVCFIGQGVQTALSAYQVNKAFISSQGIKYGWGLSEANESAVLVKREMMNIADKTIVLMDKSKFGISDFVQVAPLDKIDLIITNADIPGNYIAQLKEHAEKVKKAAADVTAH